MMPVQLKRVSDTVWEIPRSLQGGGCSCRPGSSPRKKLIDAMDDGVYDQITNVACLPGILKYAFCMPDGHWGYGFPIGGVAAMDPHTGVISPGGIGFDINCGMRLVLTNLTYDEVKPHLHDLVDRLFYRVPCGVGSTGFVKLTRGDFRTVLSEGSRWALRQRLCLAGGPGAHRGGGLLQGRRSREGQRKGHRPRVRPGRHPRGRETTTARSRWRSPRTSSTRPWPSAWDSRSPTRWRSCSTAGAGDSATRWPRTTSRCS